MDDIIDYTKILQNKISRLIRVAMPARIETYDFKTQKATVKVDMKEKINSEQTIDNPVLNSVPVLFPSSGGASMTFPVKRGDFCLLIFFDRDASKWLLGAYNEKPATDRAHAISDAVAIVGLNPFVVSSKAKNNTDVLLTYDNSEISLKPNGVIDVISAKQINVKTEQIIINCKSATINVEEQTTLNSKNLVANINESANINAKSINVTASEAAQINAKTLTATVQESANISCKSSTVTVTETATLNCNNLTMQANNNINTQSVEFTHTGNLKITGTLEVEGVITSNGIDNVSNTITTSGVVVDTHTHTYEKPVAGSNPTATVPATATGAMQ